MPSRRVRIAWWLGALALAAIALLGAVHLPPVQARVVEWALARARAATGLDITVQSASYDLPALSASAHGVVVAVPGEQPFLDIGDATVTVPFSALFGSFRIATVDVVQPRVTVVQRADGSMNLPPAGGGGTGGGGLPLEIGALLVRDGRASYRAAAGTTADVSGLSLRLTGGAGTLAGALSAQDVSVAADGVQIPGGKLDGVVRYDGASLLVDQIAYAAAFEGGQLTVGGRFTTQPLHLAGNVAWQNVRTLPLSRPRAPVGIASRLSGHADVDWTADGGLGGLAVSLDNRATAETASTGSMGLDGDLSFRLANGEWQLHQEHRVAGAVDTSGDLTGRLDAVDPAASTVGGTVDVSSADLAAAARVLARAGIGLPDWARSPAGRLQARLHVGGTVGAPTVNGDATLGGGRIAGFAPIAARSSFAVDVGAASGHGTVDVEVPEIAGQTTGTVTTNLAYANGRIRATDIAIAQLGGGRVSGSAEYRVATGAYAATLQLAAVSVRPVILNGKTWPVSATVDGTVAARGTVDRPGADAALSLSAVEWNGETLAAATVDLSLADGRATVRARVPDYAATLEGGIGVAAPHAFTATAAVQDLDPATIIARAGHDWPPFVRRLAGAVTVRASASGSADDLERATAQVDLERIDLQSGGARLALAAPATVQYAGRRVTVDDLRLTTTGAQAEVSGAIGVDSGAGALRASLRGDLTSARPWLSLAGAPEDLTLAGTVDADVSASGSIQQPRLAGRLQLANGRIAWTTYPAATDVAVDASIDNGVIDAARVAAQWQGATASGHLVVPLAMLSERLAVPSSGPAPTASFSGRIDGITERALEPFAGTSIAANLAGRAGVQVDLQASRLSVASLHGTVVMDDFGLTAEGVEISQVRPTRLELEGSTVRVGDWSWQAAGNRFDVTGTAALASGGALDLNVAGRIDLRVLGAVWPDVATGGLADVTLHVTGAPSSPLADGTLQITNGELRIQDPQVAVTNAQGRATLSGNRIEIAGLQGAINGGRFTASGRLQREGFAPSSGSLTVTATGVTLDVPEGLRTQVDSTLTFDVGARQQLSGTVTIQRGAYREPLSLAMDLLGSAHARTVESGTAPGVAAAKIDLNVALVSAQDLVIDNNYGRMDVGVDVRLVGTVAQPSVVGRATIREGGVVYLGGRTYQVERGTIDFTNPREIVPDLDLVARTRISGYDVSLSIAGTPDTIKGTLSSDPPLGQSDIVSLLVTGRTAEQNGGAAPQVAGGEVLAYLSGEALGFAAQAVGLDTLRLERGASVEEFNTDPSLIAGDADPSTRLTVSKRFSRYAEVVLSQNLSQGGAFTWIVSFTPGRHVELRALSLDDQSRAYELRHDLSFGGPPVPRPTGSAGAEASGRVTAVRFTGDPGFPESELRRQINLKAGDQFDFYHWQDDRERLRRFYLDRGYLEARVSARHDESASAGENAVALEYDIDRGPSCVLDVEGDTLPSDVRRQLRTLWSDAIFDEALMDDLQTAVRRSLADRGYLRAGVTVSKPDLSISGEKHIRITIDPGPKSASRDVRFIGNHEIADARLEPLVDGSAIWLDPSSLGQAVAALYRSEGFLAVSVAAGPVDFEGDRAVLPVRIEEGPAFVVSRVGVDGAKLRPAADVRAAFAMAPSDRYTDAALDRGRKAVELDYARHGFNQATASVQTAVDSKAGTVAITISVDEGPQQVLQSVDVSGASGVRPGVIAGALKLKTGEPVNLDQWYAARRRLFDTGLFQRVDVAPQPLPNAEHPDGVQPVAAHVTLLRQAPWRLRYGLEVTDAPAPASDQGRVFGAGINGDLQRRGLFGHPGTLGLTARLDHDRTIGRSYLTLPTLFGRQVSTSFFLSRSRQRLAQQGYLPIVADLWTVTAEQRFTPWRKLQIAYGYQFQWNHTYLTDQTDPLAFDETTKEARLTTTAIVDTRNDPFNATSGQFHSSNVELGVSRLGSDVRFIKYVMQQFIYQPLGGSVVSASGVRLGAGRGFGQDLLPSERFFVGGVNTVRGYANDSLGAIFLGSPTGGQASLTLNQEIRFPVFRWVRGVGFVDAGNVFDRASELSFTNLAVGAGAGLRFSTPVGLFRVDLGFPLPANGRKPLIYVAFGQMF